MIVRAIDGTGDWEYGKGKNDYKSANDAVTQNIGTRLYSFLGDCFFDTAAGIDWFNFLGSKNEVGLNLAVSATILNTENVTGILQLSINLSANRNVTIRYKVQTTYSQISGTFQYDLNGLG